MRIDLTIRSNRGDLDVAVIASDAVPLAMVRERLTDLAGLDAACTLHCSNRTLHDSARIGFGDLRSGALVQATHGGTEAAATALSLALHVVCGPSAGSVVALGRAAVSIGRDETCDLVLRDDRVSRRHASLRVTPVGVAVTDHASTNGTRVDGIRVCSDGAVSAPVTLARDGLVRVGDSLLAVRSTDLTPAARTAAAGTILVNRAPRPAGPPSPGEILVPEPRRAARPRPIQWLAALVPAAVAGGLAWFTGSLVFLLLGVLSPVMLLSGALGERVTWRRSRHRNAASDRVLNAEIAERITAGVRAESIMRRAAAPDPVLLSEIATMPASRLWERRRGDPDHLSVRIGCADLPSELARREGSRREPAGVLSDVPLCVDLRDGPIGLVGPPAVVAGLARWLTAQLATLHSPADVDLVLLVSNDAVEAWSWARWLPHLAGRVAVCATSWRAMITELTRTTVDRGGTGPPSRWTVLVLDRAASLGDVPGLGALLDAGPRLGVTAICVDTDAQALPTACTSVVRVLDGAGTRVVLDRANDCAVESLVDVVSTDWADAVARALAPLADAGAPDVATTPLECTLLDLLEVDRLDVELVSHWWAASTGRADIVVGLGAGGSVSVDLAADGPHALIAGTTGAGKSQLLQTLVLGLALRHPPAEIEFVLIDYKGGAAFAHCARLPHAVGMVTDLDPQLARRALRSLDAELRHRERLFANAGVADLGTYRALSPAEPLPRLVLVIDEFATLAEELPDFVRGVVAVAQRGRSLGVHLILATQRPGRAVTPDIRANTSLRIALRVTDPGESADVIGAPDAAAISRDLPGRAYLRAGDRLEGFQTARTDGASTRTAAATVERLGAWRRRTDDGNSGPEDGSATMVDVVIAAASQTGEPTARSPWRPPLPDLLPLDSLGKSSAPRRLRVGRLDLPAEQTQPALELDLARADSLLLVGAPRSGRTTALATIALAAAAALGPGDLAVHVIDPVGASLLTALNGLPHLGTAIGPGDESIVAALLRRLLGQRGKDGPAVLVLIDSWDRYVAGLGDAERARTEDLLAALLRAGPAAGITVAVSGDRTLLAPRIAGAFGIRLLLRPIDRGDYLPAGVTTADLPTRMPPGRAVRVSDGTEVQLAHPGRRAALDELGRVAAALGTRWPGPTAPPDVPRLRSLPDRVPLDSLSCERGRFTVGLGGDTAALVSVDLFGGARRMVVAGPARAGKSTALLILLAQAVSAGVDVVVAAPLRSPLLAAARAAAVPVVLPGGSPELIGPPVTRRRLLLVDDSESFVDTGAGERLAALVRSDSASLAVVLAGRCDELASSYRGLGAEVRRARCGILLHPGPIDGELLGVQLTRRATSGDPPGRGVLVGDAGWGPSYGDGQPIPIQVATHAGRT